MTPSEQLTAGLRCTVVTIFPQLGSAFAEVGVVGSACRQGVVALDSVNPRQFTHNRHQSVDDRPYGGGPGMVMKVEPLMHSIADIKQRHPETLVVMSSPQGPQFNQRMAQQWLHSGRHITLVAGRYEGIDERFCQLAVEQEVSLGDFVLSGGELACLAMFDAMARLVPGVLGHADSADEDSFSQGLLDCPHYTRPEVYEDLTVPPVLLSGNHQAIAKWRQAQRVQRTRERRPELLAMAQYSAGE